MVRRDYRASDYAVLMLRVLLGSLFIAHLYWKFTVLSGGLHAWSSGLVQSGYPAIVPAYVLSAELAGALLLIPGIFTRLVALYAIPMMLGAAQFWLVRKGFYFTKAGAELPLVWVALLIIQVVAGDGAWALTPSLSRLLHWRARQDSNPRGRTAAETRTQQVRSRGR